MSESQTNAAPAPPEEKDPSFDKFTDDFFQRKPDVPAADKPAETPASPAPAAPATPAQPAAPTKRIVKWKNEEGEHDFDIDEHYSDEAKRARLRELIEKGDGFDRVVPRRQAEAVRGAFKELQLQAREAGYDLKWNAQLGKAEIVPLAPATAQQPTATQPAPDVATLREKRKALAAKVAEGDSDAIVEDYRLQDQIHALELAEVRRQADEIKAWKTQQDAAAQESAKTQFTRDLTDFATRAREKRKDSFHGMSDTDYWKLVQSFVPMSQTWEELSSHIDGYANRLDSVVSERVKAMTNGVAKPTAAPAGPAPAAPPAMGGTPPASGGPGTDKSKLTKSTLEMTDKDYEEWFRS